MQKKLAQKEKEAKEMHLRMLAQKAREERSGIVGAGMSVGATAEEIADARGVAAAATEEPYAPPRTRDEGRGVADDKDEDYNERERLRREAQRDVQRKIRMTHMGADARARMAGGDRERDVSEKIALGGAAPTGGKEAQYDQRLFSQSTGLSAGFRDEDAYDLYDKPLFQGTSTSVYRPTRGAGVDGPDAEASADAEIAKLSSTSRFVPDRGFQGADAAGPRDGPVQFEKADDPFGIDKFLEDATRGGDGTKGKRGVGEEEGRGGDQDKRRRHD